jgi:hypothetical protein
MMQQHQTLATGTARIFVSPKNQIIFAKNKHIRKSKPSRAEMSDGLLVFLGPALIHPPYGGASRILRRISTFLSVLVQGKGHMPYLLRHF